MLSMAKNKPKNSCDIFFNINYNPTSSKSYLPIIIKQEIEPKKILRQTVVVEPCILAQKNSLFLPNGLFAQFLKK